MKMQAQESKQVENVRVLLLVMNCLPYLMLIVSGYQLRVRKQVQKFKVRGISRYLAIVKFITDFFFLVSWCITFLCLQVKCLCFYLKGVSFWEPKVWDSLSWRKQKSQNLFPISAAVSSFNKFDNDGSFMHKFLLLQNDEANKLIVRVTGISISHPN